LLNERLIVDAINVFPEKRLDEFFFTEKGGYRGLKSSHLSASTKQKIRL
jgi:hypothetical protein